MAATVGQATASNGRARLMVYLPGALRDRLARAAFEAGRPVSGIVEDAVVEALDAADAPPPEHEVPQARWVAMIDGSWGTTAAPCPADPTRGALVTLHGKDGSWAATVQVGGAMWQMNPLRSRTAAMLEAEALARILTPQAVTAQLQAASRKGRR